MLHCFCAICPSLLVLARPELVLQLLDASVLIYMLEDV